MRTGFLLRLLLLSIVPLSFAHAQLVEPACGSDVKVVAQIRGEQSVFHIGEVIPLDLAFTSSSPGKYQFDNATYDRSGRLNEEQFALEPSSGWDDPLALYFRSYTGFIGGGLRGIGVLSEKPETVHLELNEWVRFDSPGVYKLRVSSRRVSVIHAATYGGCEVSSNELALKIVAATKEWQQGTLKQALADVDASKPNRYAAPDPADLRRKAIKTLRYLGTTAAAREMARRMGSEDAEWDFAAGLIGTPDRDAALEEMKTLLADPSFPVSARFISTMSVLAVPEEASPKTAPQLRADAEAGFRQDLIAALPAKQGTAAAVSTQTIVEESAIRSQSLPPDLKRGMTRALVTNFDKLSVEKQAELLQYRWPALDHEEMLPLLRKVATQYEDFPQLRAINAWNSLAASGAALQHWYELAPDEARPAIIKEILRPKPRYNDSVLGMLPDKSLPEVEQPLADHLISQSDFDVRANIASLIARYATGGIEPAVSAYLDERLGKLECSVQEPLLAYLIKVDPESARVRVQTAMAARGEGFTACNHSLLTGVARLQNNSVLQDIAIKGLDDPDPQVVENAAAYLKDYGSASAEDVLWEHLTSWSQRWMGRENDLQYVPGRKLDLTYELGAGTNLQQALATGHAWLADEAKLRRLIGLSIGPQQRQQAQQILDTWMRRPWTVQFLGRGQFFILQYNEHSVEAAKEKLSQFPAGSTLQWSGGGLQDHDKMFEELSRAAAEHQVKLLPEPVSAAK